MAENYATFLLNIYSQLFGHNGLLTDDSVAREKKSGIGMKVFDMSPTFKLEKYQYNVFGLGGMGIMVALRVIDGNTHKVHNLNSFVAVNFILYWLIYVLVQKSRAESQNEAEGEG